MNTEESQKKSGLRPPFKRGEVHSPGRPKGALDGPRAHLRRIVRKVVGPISLEKLKKLGLDIERIRSNGQALAELEMHLALSGNRPAMNKVWEQAEEPLTQKIEASGDLVGACRVLSRAEREEVLSGLVSAGVDLESILRRVKGKDGSSAG